MEINKKQWGIGAEVRLACTPGALTSDTRSPRNEHHEFAANGGGLQGEAGICHILSHGLAAGRARTALGGGGRAGRGHVGGVALAVWIGVRFTRCLVEEKLERGRGPERGALA